MTQRWRGTSTTSVGRSAEAYVASWLQERGFQIVARNLRLGYLELDLVARKGPLIAVVEVRTRGTGALTTGLSSLGQQKRLRIRQAGTRLWNLRYRRDASVERLRFDVAVVHRSPQGPWVDYVPGAF